MTVTKVHCEACGDEDLRGCIGVTPYDSNAFAAGRDAERAAVSAYLSERAAKAEYPWSAMLDEEAAAIERGEHLEKPTGAK